MKILVLTGPNLGRLGTREPEIYGSSTYADLEEMCEQEAKLLGVEVDTRQTDTEGRMLTWLHEAADENLPVVLNAGAWTHYSIAVRDACSMLTAPLVEVHISNIHAREEFRRHSVLSPVAKGVICGLGFHGYTLAIRWLATADHRTPRGVLSLVDPAEEASQRMASV